MFVIMGVTGQVGGAALEALKQRGIALRAVARDPARAQGLGVEIVRGDAADSESLVAAFSGAQAAFVMLVPPYQARDVVAESRVMARSVADAVRAARAAMRAKEAELRARLDGRAGTLADELDEGDVVHVDGRPVEAGQVIVLRQVAPGQTSRRRAAR